MLEGAAADGVYASVAVGPRTAQRSHLIGADRLRFGTGSDRLKPVRASGDAIGVGVKAACAGTLPITRDMTALCGAHTDAALHLRGSNPVEHETSLTLQVGRRGVSAPGATWPTYYNTRLSHMSADRATGAGP